MSRVLVLAPSFHPAVNAGGPARDITNLVDLVSRKHDVEVITADRDLGQETPFAGISGTIHRGDALIHYVDPTDLWAVSQRVRSCSCSPIDILLLNSIWNVPFSLLPAALLLSGRLHARTTVLLPRGELEEGALALKARKKRLAAPPIRALYRRVVAVGAATSSSEAASLQRWLSGRPVVMVSETPDSVAYGERFNDSGRLRLLFLGRIHPTKGLLELLGSLGHVGSDVTLDIAGPIEDEIYWSRCREAISRLPSRIDVKLLGPVVRDEIPRLLHEHDALVALTAGENFGHVFAEALQAGCPIVATDRTPWTSTLQDGGGWVVASRDDHRAVAQVLRSLAEMSPEKRLQARRSAREAFERWATIREPNVLDRVVAWQEEGS